MVTTGIYILLVLMFGFDVSWKNSSLPTFFGLTRSSLADTVSRRDTVHDANNTTSIRSVLVIAVSNSDIPILPGFLVAVLIFAALSAANTALYVASRQFFGLRLSIPWGSNSWLLRKLGYLGATNGNNVPASALLVSALTFGSWVPALHFAPQHVKIYDVSELRRRSLVYGMLISIVSFKRYLVLLEFRDACLSGVVNVLRSSGIENGKSSYSSNAPNLERR